MAGREGLGQVLARAAGAALPTVGVGSYLIGVASYHSGSDRLPERVGCSPLLA